ncbi:MAG: hypothetical protein P8J87_00275, partial [Verrucomicrobiales bacterium]|nr:hypothetical protein [Verrucomicrobiales bacterium]
CRSLERCGFRLHVFEKQVWPERGVVEFENGDFIAATGTLFFRGEKGETALRSLFEASAAEGFEFRDLKGHFAVFVYRDGKLEIFNDFNGLYHVFSAGDGERLLSSSFLAACAALKDKTVSEHEIYEFLVFGAFYGERTIFEEVRGLRARYRYFLGEATERVEKRLGVLDEVRTGERFEDYRDEVVEEVSGYFEMLVACYGEKICSALSGGYDSRMMLAALRSQGVTPQLYVYGGKGSKDREIAAAICRGEGLELDAVDKLGRKRIEAQAFPEAFERQLLSLDGRSLLGAADDGTDLETRRERLQKAELQLNGAGGEIYRQYWQLRDIRMTARRFVSMSYERSYVPFYDGCAAGFQRQAFFERFAEKVHAAVSDDGFGATLERWQIEQIYPLIRLKYCMNLCYYHNNMMSASLTPFLEPTLTLPSHRMPLRYKMHGALQKAAIAAMDPAVARYISQDGLDYASPTPLLRRVKNHLKVTERTRVKSRLPITVLTRLYRRKKEQGGGGESRRPYFEGEAYVRELFGAGEWMSDAYFRRDGAWDESQYSRLLTLEYLLRYFR